MCEPELLKRISELEVQNRALSEENAKLREALGWSQNDIVAPKSV